MRAKLLRSDILLNLFATDRENEREIKRSSVQRKNLMLNEQLKILIVNIYAPQKSGIHSFQCESIKDKHGDPLTYKIHKHVRSKSPNPYHWRPKHIYPKNATALKKKHFAYVLYTADKKKDK